MIHGMIHKTKGKSFFVLISVPPENKKSRAMLHMVTVKAHGDCLVVQPPENKKDRILGIGLEFCGYVFLRFLIRIISLKYFKCELPAT